MTSTPWGQKQDTGRNGIWPHDLYDTRSPQDSISKYHYVVVVRLPFYLGNYLWWTSEISYPRQLINSGPVVSRTEQGGCFVVYAALMMVCGYLGFRIMLQDVCLSDPPRLGVAGLSGSVCDAIVRDLCVCAWSWWLPGITHACLCGRLATELFDPCFLVKRLSVRLSACRKGYTVFWLAPFSKSRPTTQVLFAFVLFSFVFVLFCFLLCLFSVVSNMLLSFHCFSILIRVLKTCLHFFNVFVYFRPSPEFFAWHCMRWHRTKYTFWPAYYLES